MVVTPKDAATLILLRQAVPHGSGIEVLMLQRHANSAFMPGAYVFPGGMVEVADYAPEVERICHGLSFEKARGIINSASPPERALGFFVAAIRETFEEAGILLACRESSALAALDEEQKARFAGYRDKVHGDPVAFMPVIEQEGLKLATDSLCYFAHWITPEASPIRFDARFFVASAPPDQEAWPDGLETTVAKWISPQELLEEHRKEVLFLPVPTLSSVSTLARFSSVDEVIASTRGKVIHVGHG